MENRESNGIGHAREYVDDSAQQSEYVKIEEMKKRVKNAGGTMSQPQLHGPEPEKGSQEPGCVVTEEAKDTSPPNHASVRVHSEETSVALPKPEYRSVPAHVKRRTDHKIHAVQPPANASSSRPVPTDQRKNHSSRKQ
ncbi:hypothetical protein CMQ_3168 [Grosmannia clavigera kw1407]|uniref:Uncharacterized protein n=1 Tax=Grosmannia clavigera (strain kw1407 / UAMH 11150) TaxID=655863 RepID=F0XGW4_GROCL|nr:uncharacterized protein CMQ_3168 [Grosmannia clavigera kw1407]EFX03239.1 hypothetical protein CMQ_3168 [Grosmannia clavigera kw1407]